MKKITIQDDLKKLIEDIDASDANYEKAEKSTSQFPVILKILICLFQDLIFIYKDLSNLEQL